MLGLTFSHLDRLFNSSVSFDWNHEYIIWNMIQFFTTLILQTYIRKKKIIIKSTLWYKAVASEREDRRTFLLFYSTCSISFNEAFRIPLNECLVLLFLNFNFFLFYLLFCTNSMLIPLHIQDSGDDEEENTEESKLN